MKRVQAKNPGKRIRLGRRAAPIGDLQGAGGKILPIPEERCGAVHSAQGLTDEIALRLEQLFRAGEGLLSTLNLLGSKGAGRIETRWNVLQFCGGDAGTGPIHDREGSGL